MKSVKQIISSKKFIFLLLLFSITFNIICIIPYVNGYWNRLSEYMNPTEFFTENSNDQDVIHAVVKSSTQIEDKLFVTQHPNMGLIPDIRRFFSFEKQEIDRKNNYFIAYLYAGLSYYALYHHDLSVLKHLESESNEFIENGKLNYEISEIDQIPIGLLFVNLYKMTNNAQYLDISKQLYQKIIACSKEGIIDYRPKSPNQFSDGVGMFIPFLVEYANLLGLDTSEGEAAYELAVNNLHHFYLYGCDKETGVPAHGFNKNTHIKVGSANWGRGIGWFLLAASFIPELEFERLDASLSKMNYSQFPLSSNLFDSTTALMFEIYKMSRDNKRDLSLSFIKPYITVNGLVTKCSGDTYDLNNYSHLFGPSELSNGLFLLLISKYMK